MRKKGDYKLKAPSRKNRLKQRMKDIVTVITGTFRHKATCRVSFQDMIYTLWKKISKIQVVFFPHTRNAYWRYVFESGLYLTDTSTTPSVNDRL